MKIGSIIKAITLLILFSSSLTVGYGATVRSPKGSAKDEKFYINLLYQNAKPEDTLILVKINLMNHFRKTEFIKTSKNGFYRYEIPVHEDCGYWQLMKLDRQYSATGNYINRPLTIPLFWERGDSVNLVLSNKEVQVGVYSTYQFSGPGAAKYKVRTDVFDTNNAKKIVRETSSAPLFDEQYNFIKPVSNFDKFSLQILEDYKSSLSDLSYNVLKADILYQSGSGIYYEIKMFYNARVSFLKPEAKKDFLFHYDQTFGKIISKGISEQGLSKSLNAIGYLFKKFQSNTYVTYGKDSLLATYDLIKDKATGELRDRILLYMFSTEKHFNSGVYLNAERLFTTVEGKREFVTLRRRLLPGFALHNYSLWDIKGNTVSLNKFKDKTILLDFWSIGCGPCSSYYKEVLSKAEKEFKNNNQVVFVTVSVDRKRQRWIDAVNSGDYTSSEAINLYTGGGGMDHNLIKDNNIVGLPTVILVDKKGNVIFFKTENLDTLTGLTAAIRTSL